jgi:outer membrane protein OmpA-like peptidoglycan-associated protein
MKRLSLLFSILLIAWISFASYWYVCKVRNNCGEEDQVPLSEMNDDISTEEASAEPASVPERDSLTIALEYLNGVGTKKYYFKFASSKLNAVNDDETYFSSLGYFLANTPGSTVTAVGHACSRGSKQANDRFSRLRAETVKQYLIRKGIAGEQIIPEWKGDTEPAASNETEDGRKLNRRVEININQ